MYLDLESTRDSKCCKESAQTTVYAGADTNESLTLYPALKIDYHGYGRVNPDWVQSAGEQALKTVFAKESAAELLTDLSERDWRRGLEGKLGTAVSMMLKGFQVTVDNVELTKLGVPDEYYNLYQASQRKVELDSIGKQIEARKRSYLPEPFPFIY